MNGTVLDESPRVKPLLEAPAGHTQFAEGPAVDKELASNKSREPLSLGASCGTPTDTGQLSLSSLWVTQPLRRDRASTKAPQKVAA
jgi:hypothetical protein